MCHCDAALFQPSGPRFRISGGGKYDFDAFLHHDVHDFLYLWVHQRNIYPERFAGSRPAFTNMFTQNVGIHRTGAYQSQTTGITDSRSKLPAATPHHTTLNYRISYSK